MICRLPSTVPRAMLSYTMVSSPAVLLLTLCILRISTITNGYGISFRQPEPQPLQSTHGISTHRVPLRFHDPQAPYTFAVTTAVSLNDTDDSRTSYNFLATQVWPSSRTAAVIVEKFMSKQQEGQQRMIVCEFGCGPGLPSIAAAVSSGDWCTVIATDLDPVALLLVEQAAVEQNVSHRVVAQSFDLTTNVMNDVPKADLYILSDVFENGRVAVGAAQITAYILNTYSNSSMWVFAQSDRSQREIYLRELRKQLNVSSSELNWCTSIDPPNIRNYNLPEANALPVPSQWTDRLWLCDIDETNVFYGS